MKEIAIPATIKARISQGLVDYAKIIRTAKLKKVNEADTSSIVHGVLNDILGYDVFEITAQYRIRGQYADYVITRRNQPLMVVEVKSIGLKLNENHLIQSTNYAAQNGIEWALLTNALSWQLYHLTYGKGINKFPVFDIEILDKKQKRSEKIEYLYALSKEGLAKNVLSRIYQEKLALSAENIKKVVLSTAILNKVKSELKDITGQEVPMEDLREILERKLAA